MTDHVAVLSQLLGDPSLQFREIRADPSGIRMVLDDPAMATLVDTLATNATWIVTRSAGTNVAIEPRYTLVRPVFAGTPLFHVSDCANQSSILANGIQLGQGGNTTLNRGYPPRTHLAIRLGDALAFIYSQVTRRPPVSFVGGVLTTSARTLQPRLLNDLDLYEVSAPAADYYQDSHFAGGIWTETIIPPQDLKLVPHSWWLPIYQTLYP